MEIRVYSSWKFIGQVRIKMIIFSCNSFCSYRSHSHHNYTLLQPAHSLGWRSCRYEQLLGLRHEPVALCAQGWLATHRGQDQQPSLPPFPSILLNPHHHHDHPSASCVWDLYREHPCKPTPLQTSHPTPTVPSTSYLIERVFPPPTPTITTFITVCNSFYPLID